MTTDIGAESIRERITVAQAVLRRMDAAALLRGRANASANVVWPFERRHEQLVQDVRDAMLPWTGSRVSVEIAEHLTAPKTYRVLVCQWIGD